MKNSQPIMKWSDGQPRTTNLPIEKLSFGKLDSIQQIVKSAPSDNLIIHGFSVKRWKDAINEIIKERDSKMLGFLMAFEHHNRGTKSAIMVENVLVKMRIFNNEQFVVLVSFLNNRLSLICVNPSCSIEDFGIQADRNSKINKRYLMFLS